MQAIRAARCSRPAFSAAPQRRFTRSAIVAMAESKPKLDKSTPESVWKTILGAKEVSGATCVRACVEFRVRGAASYAVERPWGDAPLFWQVSVPCIHARCMHEWEGARVGS